MKFTKKSLMYNGRLRNDVISGKASSILGKIFLYLLLIAFGFVFLYPMFVIISTSGKDLFDLSNSSVNWIPTKFTLDNYQKAFKVLGGYKTLITTIVVMLIVSVSQTFSASVIAYGFAKYDFWGKKIWFALMISTFILPLQITFLPKYVMFNSYKLLGTVFPVLLPSLFGQGIKNAIFILIFYQFFKMSPKSLDEAASIDGASHFKIFSVINMRMAVPAIVVVFIFSFVWNWNETYVSSSYFGNTIQTLPIALEKFRVQFEKMFPIGANSNPATRINDGILMAGTFLCIVPLLVAYVFIERQLVESIDKSGITGE